MEEADKLTSSWPEAPAPCRSIQKERSDPGFQTRDIFTLGLAFPLLKGLWTLINASLPTPLYVLPWD